MLWICRYSQFTSLHILISLFPQNILCSPTKIQVYYTGPSGMMSCMEISSAQFVHPNSEIVRRMNQESNEQRIGRWSGPQGKVCSPTKIYMNCAGPGKMTSCMACCRKSCLPQRAFIADIETVNTLTGERRPNSKDQAHTQSFFFTSRSFLDLSISLYLHITL